MKIMYIHICIYLPTYLFHLCTSVIFKDFFYCWLKGNFAQKRKAFMYLPRTYYYLPTVRSAHCLSMSLTKEAQAMKRSVISGEQIKIIWYSQNKETS